jgi:hypothetical protein
MLVESAVWNSSNIKMNEEKSNEIYNRTYVLGAMDNGLNIGVETACFDLLFLSPFEENSNVAF